MVAFASLIGAAAIYAGVAVARPMMDNSPSNSWSSDSGSPTPPPYGSPTSPPYSSPTSPPYPASSAPAMSYGSGSMSWNNNGGYDSCVQQCVAQFGPPPSMSPNSTSPPSGNGTGTTHTIIVAPSQGVLRFVPPMLNASVGDTLLFKWNANNHTVTKSSQLELCNKTGDHPFASGEQNKGFEFTQVVNTTDTIFYYCGTPTHCQKGMFGVINPPSAYAAASDMTSLATQYSSVQNALSITTNATSNNTAAANWGMNLNMSGIPDWAHPYMAENIMYTRLIMAANPDVVKSDGSLDLSNMGSNPMVIPQDFAVAQDNAQYASSTSSGATSTPTSGKKNGASALASPRVAVALVAVAAIFFAL